MKKSSLITQDGSELPCVILPVEKSLFPIGKEVLVYCQNRLVRGYIQDDDEFTAEIEVVADFAIIPEYDEFLKEHESNGKEEIICIGWF